MPPPWSPQWAELGRQPRARGPTTNGLRPPAGCCFSLDCLQRGGRFLWHKRVRAPTSGKRQEGLPPLPPAREGLVEGVYSTGRGGLACLLGCSRLVWLRLIVDTLVVAPDGRERGPPRPERVSYLALLHVKTARHTSGGLYISVTTHQCTVSLSRSLRTSRVVCRARARLTRAHATSESASSPQRTTRTREGAFTACARHSRAGAASRPSAPACQRACQRTDRRSAA